MTAQPATQFKLPEKIEDSVVYVVSIEDEDPIVIQGSQNLRDSIIYHFDGELVDFYRDPYSKEFEGYWHDEAVGQSFRIRAIPVEAYGVKS